MYTHYLKKTVKVLNDVDDLLSHDLFDPLTSVPITKDTVAIDLPGVEEDRILIGWRQNTVVIKVDDEVVAKYSFSDGSRENDFDVTYKAGRVTFERKKPDGDEKITFKKL